MKNLRTTVCGCGHQMTMKDSAPPLERNKIHGFYGGRVSWFIKGICPDCGAEYKLYLKPISGTYEIIDMELAKAAKKKEGKDKK